MRYFSYIAEQSFKTSPRGERFFMPIGPWAIAYLIPDEATERGLLKKHRWLLRIFFGLFISG